MASFDKIYSSQSLKKPQTEISVQGKQDKTKLVLGEITNIPVFYLGLPRNILNKE